jgi:hypothetical protein
MWFKIGINLENIDEILVDNIYYIKNIVFIIIKSEIKYSFTYFLRLFKTF